LVKRIIVLDWTFVGLAVHTLAWFLLSSALARTSENINFVSVFDQSNKFVLTPHQLDFVVLKWRAQMEGSHAFDGRPTELIEL
jgi:hypothetical protein